MSIITSAEPVPLVSDSDGVVTVGATRVTLDTVVAAFQEGVTPEGIVDQYPSIQLADVYAVLGYVLRHESEIDEYLRTRQKVADTVRRENEVRFSPGGVRERLLARQQK